MLCFTLYSRANSKYKPPRGLIFGGAIERRIFRVTILWGLYLEGLINGMAYFRNFTLFGLSITRQTSDANDLVYAKNHAREKPLLTGDIYRNYFEDASHLSSTLGTRGFFSRVRRGTSFCRPQAELTRAETAQPGTQGTSLPITDGA